MPRKCTICNDAINVKRINNLIRNGKSYRGIALQIYDKENRHMSIIRHASKCLKLDFQTYQEQIKKKQAIDHHKELNEEFEFAKDLRTAARDYLTCPETGELTLTPRSNEIEVIYFDYIDVKPNGEPKRKRALLQELLDKITQKRKCEVNKVTTKHIDIRSFALDAVKTSDLVLDKFAKIQGLYTEKKENPENLSPFEKAKQQINNIINDFSESYQDKENIVQLIDVMAKSKRQQLNESDVQRLKEEFVN